MRPLFKTLEAIAVGTSQYYGDLSLTPLIARPDMPTCPPYKSLDEDGTIVISEMSKAGSVPNLLADNSGNEPVLFLDGEELVGAKQNRIANVTMLLPARTKTTILVSCVKARRWSYRRRHFSSAGHTHFLSGRARKAVSISANLKLQMSRQSDQRQIWSDIDDVMSRLKVRSNTSSIHDAYQERATDLDMYREAFKPDPAQVGLIYRLNGNVRWVGFVRGTGNLRTCIAKANPRRSFASHRCAPATLHWFRPLSPFLEGGHKRKLRPIRRGRTGRRAPDFEAQHRRRRTRRR